MNNQKIITQAAIDTGSLTSGLLNPEQSRRFLQQTFEATNLGPLVRHEMRTAKSGEIDKIGIDRRILRKKTEGTDDNYRTNVKTSAIEYNTTAVRLPWEITEETLRENIEGQGLEGTITNLMTTQMGIDGEDLYLNGDEEIDAANPDFDFLKINDGWIKQVSNGGHVYDAAEGKMSLDLFYNTLAQLPNKYNNGRLRWRSQTAAHPRAWWGKTDKFSLFPCSVLHFRAAFSYETGLRMPRRHKPCSLYCSRSSIIPIKRFIRKLTRFPPIAGAGVGRSICTYPSPVSFEISSSRFSQT